MIDAEVPERTCFFWARDFIDLDKHLMRRSYNRLRRDGGHGGARNAHAARAALFAARLGSVCFHNEIRVVSGLFADAVIGHNQRRARRQQCSDTLHHIWRHFDAVESSVGFVG